jgi:hypothetical protein
MNLSRHLPFTLILLCFLTACGDTHDDIPVGKDTSIPDKTMNGEDIMVCMINTDLNVEVYREDREYQFSEEDVKADWIYNSAIPLIKLSARHRPNDDLKQETRIDFVMLIENVQPNTAYHVNASYSGPRGEFNGDNNTSILRFSRIDSTVAAGEFTFIGISKNNDSVRFGGYFDIPFADR